MRQIWSTLDDGVAPLADDIQHWRFAVELTTKLTSHSHTLAVAAALALPSGAAHAQPMLEEVVVTAQKREESLQDVPISVSALSGERVNDAGIQRFQELAAYVPNFSISKQTIGDTIIVAPNCPAQGIKTRRSSG